MSASNQGAPEREMTGRSSPANLRGDGTAHKAGRALRLVNFGCGSDSDPSVLNFDGSLTVLIAHLPFPAALFGTRRDFVSAVRKNRVRFASDRMLRFRERSLDGFYASHVLEHLPRQRVRALLSRVRLWLRPEGVLRVVLPDLKPLAQAYVSGALRADGFVSSTGLAVDGMSWWRILLGHSYHRWMYDAESFVGLLLEIGYREPRQCAYREGRIPALAALDIVARKHESFYVEAQR